MTKRIVIFATTYFPLVGGAEVAMKEITDRIPDIRFDLICAKIKPGLARTEQIGNITVHRVGFGTRFDKFLLPFFGVGHAVRLGSAAEMPVAWSLMASFGGFAALAYTWVRPQTHFFLTLQEGDPLEHYDRRAGPFRWLHRLTFRRANAVQAISHFLAEWATRMGFQGAPEVIPNGVDLRTFFVSIDDATRESHRTRFGFNKNDIVIVTASRLSHKNAVDDLIVSLTHLPSAYKALLLGTGEDEQKLRALAAEKGVADRVVFAGHISREDLPAALQCGDVFVRASRSEGLGIAFLEAMACGVPIVGTDVGGMPDFLTDGETGVVCKVNDPASIAAAVQRIQGDTLLRARLIQNGRARVSEQYGWDRIAARMHMRLGRLLETPIAPVAPAWFRALVALIAVATTVIAMIIAARAWGLYPLYTSATVRNDVQTITAQWREQTGFGLSQFLLKRVRCTGEVCTMDVTVRTRLAPPNPPTEEWDITWPKGSPASYAFIRR